MDDLRCATPDAPPYKGLRECMRAGVAFYHSDLTGGEKASIERGMIEHRAIRVIFTTSALAEGVNLPVRRVIVHELYIGQKNNKLEPCAIALIKRHGRPHSAV